MGGLGLLGEMPVVTTMSPLRPTGHSGLTLIPAIACRRIGAFQNTPARKSMTQAAMTVWSSGVSQDQAWLQLRVRRRTERVWRFKVALEEGGRHDGDGEADCK